MLIDDDDGPTTVVGALIQRLAIAVAWVVAMLLIGGAMGYLIWLAGTLMRWAASQEGFR